MSRSKISEQELDTNNDAWRTTPLYQEAMASLGVDPSKPIKLSEKQREQLHQFVASPGMVLPHGTEFDPAGNVNRDDRGFAESGLGKSLIAAGAIGASMFIPGVAPFVLNGLQSAGSTLAGAGGSAASTAAGGSGGGMGLLSTIGNVAGKLGGWGDLVQAGGRILQGGADASAANRGTQLEAEMAGNQLNQTAYNSWMQQLRDREATGAATRNDAWKAVQQGQYVSDWKQPTQKFSPYTRDLQGPSDEMRNAGRVRQDDAFSRLAGNPIPMPEQQRFNLDPKLLQGSAWEKLQGYLGTGMDVAGDLMGGGTSRPQVDPRTGFPLRPGATTFIDPNNPLGVNADNMRGF